MCCRKVFICLPVAAFALAQQQPNFRAGGRLVLVDVIVRDSHGPIIGSYQRRFRIVRPG